MLLGKTTYFLLFHPRPRPTIPQGLKFHVPHFPWPLPHHLTDLPDPPNSPNAFRSSINYFLEYHIVFILTNEVKVHGALWRNGSASDSRTRWKYLKAGRCKLNFIPALLCSIHFANTK